MSWQENAIMYWHSGTAFVRVTDHNRTPLSIDYERIERKQRMADGTLRRHTIAKKRTWSASWTMLPSRNVGIDSGGNPNPDILGTVDEGLSGEEIEAFYYTHDGAFQMQLRKGYTEFYLAPPNLPIPTETVLVMIADFTKEVVKRGPNVDFWDLTISLEEV